MMKMMTKLSLWKLRYKSKVFDCYLYITLDLFQLENGETRVIQLPFAVSPPVIPTTAKPTAPPIIENLDGTVSKVTKDTTSKRDFFP